MPSPLYQAVSHELPGYLLMHSILSSESISASASPNDTPFCPAIVNASTALPSSAGSVSALTRSEAASLRLIRPVAVSPVLSTSRPSPCPSLSAHSRTTASGTPALRAASSPASFVPRMLKKRGESLMMGTPAASGYASFCSWLHPGRVTAAEDRSTKAGCPPWGGGAFFFMALATSRTPLTSAAGQSLGEMSAGRTEPSHCRRRPGAILSLYSVAHHTTLRTPSIAARTSPSAARSHCTSSSLSFAPAGPKASSPRPRSRTAARTRAPGCFARSSSTTSLPTRPPPPATRISSPSSAPAPCDMHSPLCLAACLGRGGRWGSGCRV
mmetsp:Transcript_47884/g.116622  ORF Transcript_47884/g.116622 Transcript_47884/m.116622 type:complete len:326 (-) Transcript_47884:103-1080(-)